MPPPPRPVAVSGERFAPVGRDVELCYQTFGDSSAEPLLLVMGLGGPMGWWSPGLCESFARAGFFVIRFDNRDTGRSSRGTARIDRTDLVRAFAGLPSGAPYEIADLADDAFGLLDHLRLESAHLLGVSMGGMVVQSMAVTRPGRVRSLVSAMSTTGRRTVGWVSPALLPMLALPRKAGREAFVSTSVLTWRAIGSPGYPRPREEMEAQAGETFDRGASASGVLRQMMAVLTQADRSPALRRLRLPAAVLHGGADKMVHVSGGRATAAAIPDAELVIIEGMGHDLPEPLWPTVVDLVRRTADRAAP